MIPMEVPNPPQTHALQAFPPVAQTLLTLDVTRNLPHIRLPLGDDDNGFSIKTAADSCAGVNIGCLQFHRGIAKLYPSAVVSFRDLQADGQEIQIGGIGKNGNPVTLTHEITYRMPYEMNGATVRISFGLSEDAAASALVGIGFFTKTRAILSFSNPAEPTLHMQAIQLNLPVEFEPSSVRDPPVRTDSAQVYTATTLPIQDPQEQDTLEMYGAAGHYGPAE